MPFSEEEMRILQLPFDDPTFELWAGQYIDALTLLFRTVIEAEKM